MPRTMQQKIFLGFTGVMVAAAFGIILGHHFEIGINRSSSLPGSVYLIIKNKEVPKIGELVAFRPGTTPVYPDLTYTKRVGGVAGDLVTQKDGVFSINGFPVAVAKKYSKAGKPLIWGPTGVIPEGFIFVYSENPDGYDSRYADIGWVSVEKVIGPAYELL